MTWLHHQVDIYTAHAVNMTEDRVQQESVMTKYLFIALFILLAHSQHAYAAPPIPATYWGQVYDSAETPLADGMTIEAIVNGNVLAVATTFSHEGESGFYLLELPGDDPDTPDMVEGALPNDSVFFRVAGVHAGETSNWVSGLYQNLPLTISAPPSAIAGLVNSSSTPSDTDVFNILILLFATGTLMAIRHKVYARGERYEDDF